MFLGILRARICNTISIKMSIVFWTPFKNIFFRPFDRPRAPKRRRIQFVWPFLPPPWILRGPQNLQKSTQWRQNPKKINLDGISATNKFRPASKVALRSAPGHHFPQIFNRFWMYFSWFSIRFGVPISTIALHAVHDWPADLSQRSCKLIARNLQKKLQQTFKTTSNGQARSWQDL